MGGGRYTGAEQLLGKDALYNATSELAKTMDGVVKAWIDQKLSAGMTLEEAKREYLAFLMEKSGVEAAFHAIEQRLVALNDKS